MSVDEDGRLIRNMCPYHSSYYSENYKMWFAYCGYDEISGEDDILLQDGCKICGIHDDFEED